MAFSIISQPFWGAPHGSYGWKPLPTGSLPHPGLQKPPLGPAGHWLGSEVLRAWKAPGTEKTMAQMTQEHDRT